ncbi:prepilin peptidase [Inquilinus sp. CAU 1745]|uniref:A24 family peptidase n=1 Tax=Inquilinus sp. CAU 1745 TaxID=3140369 RepID=UPI00325B69E6
MTVPDWPILAGFALVSLLILWAMASDIGSYTIPNRVSLGLAAAFVAYAALVRPSGLAWDVGIAAIVFAAGIGLFAAGLFGGGDVKLAGALALWVGSARMMDFLLLTALVGGGLAAAKLAARWYRKRRGGQAGSVNADDLPYGVALGIAGWLHSLWRWF